MDASVELHFQAIQSLVDPLTGKAPIGAVAEHMTAIVAINTRRIDALEAELASLTQRFAKLGRDD